MAAEAEQRRTAEGRQPLPVTSTEELRRLAAQQPPVLLPVGDQRSMNLLSHNDTLKANICLVRSRDLFNREFDVGNLARQLPNLQWASGQGEAGAGVAGPVAAAGLSGGLAVAGGVAAAVRISAGGAGEGPVVTGDNVPNASGLLRRRLGAASDPSPEQVARFVAAHVAYEADRATWRKFITVKWEETWEEEEEWRK